MNTEFMKGVVVPILTVIDSEEIIVEFCNSIWL